MTSCTSATATRSARRTAFSRRAAALIGGAAVLTAVAAAPAQAGIPDANLLDNFRTPVWTSIAMNPTGPGYWTQVDADMGGGSTQSTGGAPDLGSVSGPGGYVRATPDGKGLYVIEEDGSMYSRGDALTVPSNIGKITGWDSDDGDGTMRNPITGMAITASGQGGWILDAEGDVWTFGDAHAHGAPENNEVGSAVDIVATSTGDGYTILTDAGDVYDYGDAVFYGHPHFSASGNAYGKEATGIAFTADDKGYWILDSYGGVSPYGNATDLGDNPHPGSTLASYSTDIAALPDASGYAIIQGDGAVNLYSSTELGAPAISSPKATVLSVGRKADFQITSTRGVRHLSERGPLPRGLRFTTDRNGGATLTGKPARGSAGSYTLKLTGRTGNGAVVAHQTLTVKVVGRR